MLIIRRKEIQNRTDNVQISVVNHELYGVYPDNPTNWIVIAVFGVLTLVLLFVVLYLSKHKVNHVDEHYEHIKSRDNSADGEVAA